jgi:hypothetical protein
VLRDVPSRLGLDASSELLAFGRGRLRPHEHAVSTGFVDGFDHELADMIEDVAPVRIARAHVGRNVGELGLLTQVEADHVRYEGAHRFVVGDSIAGSVRDGDVPRRPGSQETAYAEEAVRTKRLRIEEGIVDPPINDVHALEAARRTEEDFVVIDAEIGAVHELEAHRAREEGVLEVREFSGPGVSTTAKGSSTSRGAAARKVSARCDG